VALLLWVGSAVADNKTKDPPNSNEVEIRLTDGSRVRMLILEESLLIATKYGKLTIPSRDLHRVELGIHPPAVVAQKIEEAIKRLGEKSFQERENATSDLVAVGPAAYLALHKAAKTKDPEVAQRARQVLEAIRQRVPEDKLRLREDDRIQTTEFTIVGRVLNPTLKVKSAIFGETQLNLTDLRGIHWLGQLAEVDLEVEAAKYAVNPGQWMDTGIELIMDDELVIRASGQVDLMANNPGQFLSGPEGSPQFGQGPGMYQAGTLLGRIGENGQVFVIGASHQEASKTEGKLYVQIAPGPWPRGGGHTASGSYKVSIAGGRRSQAR
jgi:hypothetical protein